MGLAKKAASIFFGAIVGLISVYVYTLFFRPSCYGYAMTCPGLIAELYHFGTIVWLAATYYIYRKLKQKVVDQ